MFDEYQKHCLKAFAAYASDERDVLLSASGGVATILSRYVLSIGGMVAGVAYSADFSDAEYILTNDYGVIDLFRGSKLILPKFNNIFEETREALEAGTIILFFGLPCIIYSLRKYLKIDFKNLITCELICSGRVSANIHKEYCSYLEGKYKSKIIQLNVRHKVAEWTPEYIFCKFQNGKTFIWPFKKTEYGQAFKIFKEEACLKCNFKGNNRTGDLMIGDFWGASPKDIFWNNKGISVVFCHTRKGLQILEKVKGLLLFEVDFEKAVKNNLSVIEVGQPHKERENLLPIFKEKGMMYAMKQSDCMRKIRLQNFFEKVPCYKFLRKVKRVVKRYV